MRYSLLILGASAAIATPNYNNHKGTFEDNHLTEADYKFMQFVSEFGRSYATKAEF